MLNGDDMIDMLAATSLRNGNGNSVVEEASDPMLADYGFLLSAFLDQMQGAAYFKDLQGRFVLINRTLAKALKVGSPADAVGKSDFDFFTAEHAGQAFADEQEIVRTGRKLPGVAGFDLYTSLAHSSAGRKARTISISFGFTGTGHLSRSARRVGN
jgi:PAS domain-containing protein